MKKLSIFLNESQRTKRAIDGLNQIKRKMYGTLVTSKQKHMDEISSFIQTAGISIEELERGMVDAKFGPMEIDLVKKLWHKK